MTSAPRLPSDTHAARKTAADRPPTLPASLSAAGHIVKVCTCCGSELTEAQWLALPRIGEQDDGTIVLELRNHGCGTTLARALRVSPSVATWERGELEIAIEDLRAETDKLPPDAAEDIHDQIALLSAEGDGR